MRLIVLSVHRKANTANAHLDGEGGRGGAEARGGDGTGADGGDGEGGSPRAREGFGLRPSMLSTRAPCVFALALWPMWVMSMLARSSQLALPGLVCR